MRLSIRAILVGLALTLAPALSAQEAKPPLAVNLIQLNQSLADIFHETNVPGASVVIIEDGAVVLSKGYGYANVAADTRVTADTVFRAGSISKSVVGIAIMMLVEEGKLSLDAKLTDLAPEIRFFNPWEVSDPVRVVHLLEHTTGFDDIGFHHYLIDGTNMPLLQAIEAYGPYRSRWRPGTWVSYCNSAPVIAGYLVEKVSGMSWADFTRTRIFEPLGMHSAHWDRAPDIVDRLARSYKADGVTEEPYVDIPGKPAGALNLTPLDLAKLVRLLIGRGTVDGVTLLKPESVSRIETPESSLASRSGFDYGYGLGNLAIPREKVVFHGHDGGIDGFLASYMYEPGHGAGFVAMINAPQVDALKAAQAITDYLQRDWPEPLDQAVNVDPVDFETITGFYQSMAPRQQMLAPLEQIADWSQVKLVGRELFINGTAREAVGLRLFQRLDRAAPTSIFLATGDGPVMLTATGASRRVPLPELIAKASWGALYALMLVIAILHLPLWVIAGLRGRLGHRGGVLVRLLPALATFSIAAFAGLLLYALVGGGDTLQALGTPSPTAYAIHALSWCIPAFGVLALTIAWRAKPGTPSSARWIATLSGLLAIIATIYLWPYGWIGLQTWM